MGFGLETQVLPFQLCTQSLVLLSKNALTKAHGVSKMDLAFPSFLSASQILQKKNNQPVDKLPSSIFQAEKTLKSKIPTTGWGIKLLFLEHMLVPHSKGLSWWAVSITSYTLTQSSTDSAREGRYSALLRVYRAPGRENHSPWLWNLPAILSGFTHRL